MNNFKKKISALALVLVAALAFTLIPADKAEAATKKNHSYSGVDYVLTVGKTKQLSNSYAVKWSSDNNKVATVDQTGKVTAKSGGVAVITATSTYGYTYEYEIGVKTKNYYPNITGMYKVGKDMPAGQYAIIHDSKSMAGDDFTYWALYKSKKGKLINNDAVSYTSIVTVKKGQYLDFNGGYAVPLKKVKKSTFSISKVNKGVSKYGTVVKVGYGFPAGTYKFTLKSGSSSGFVSVTSKDDGVNTSSSYDYISSVSKSNKSVVVTVKKGQYLRLYNCTAKKVK